MLTFQRRRNASEEKGETSVEGDYDAFPSSDALHHPSPFGFRRSQSEGNLLLDSSKLAQVCV